MENKEIPTPSQGVREVIQKLEELVQSKFYKPRPNSPKTFYKADFLISSPADVLYSTSSLIKVCIMALECSESNSCALIPEPHVNIRSTLELALQLLPYDEMECLEEILEEHINFDKITGNTESVHHKEREEVEDE